MNQIVLTGTQIFKTVILFALVFALVFIIIRLEMKLWKLKVTSFHLQNKIQKVNRLFIS